MPISEIFFVLHFLVIVFLIFHEERRPVHSAAWILLLIFLPGIGVILYVFLSGQFFTKTKQLQRAALQIRMLTQNITSLQREFLREHADETPYPLLQKYRPLIELNFYNGGRSLSTIETLDIQTNGADHFATLMTDLENAKSTIHLLYFIFKNDKIGTQIMDILCRKVREGVTVRVLYDDLGSIRTPDAFFERLVDCGGKVRPFFPIRWRVPFFINFRNHRKMVIIDAKIGYLGGNNIGDEYANQAGHPYYWRDTHIRFTGFAVATLQMSFFVSWHNDTEMSSHTLNRHKVQQYPKKLLDGGDDTGDDIVFNETVTAATMFMKSGSIPTQIVFSAPDDFNRERIKNAFIKLIVGAHKNIYIQTPYFTPEGTYVNALRLAAASGVDVRVMIPGVWDKFYVQAASSAFVRSLLPVGIRFFLYPGFIHAKTITVDDEVSSIGTSNIDVRSFSLHYEANAFFYDTNTATRNRLIFLADQEQCREAESLWYNTRPLGVQLWWNFWKLFSALL